jgi:uncharacterized membrane protein YhaH (DUF805 family)
MSIKLTMKGRIGRKDYLVSSLMVAVLTYAVALTALSFALGESGNDIPNVIAIVVSVVGFILQSALMVRRLHDLGKPGWHYWLALVPFYNLYLALNLIFTQSVKGDNRYGPEPTAA